MNWIIFMVYLYFAYYTFSYARQIWKGGSKLTSAFVAVLSFSLVGMPIWVLFMKD